jgi:beta-glucosidase-like glycosyl hydrolase
LEVSENSGRAIDLIEKAIKSGRISQASVDARVKKVLAAKLWLGLNQPKVVNTNNLYQDLNTPSAQSLVQRIADAAVTLLKSERGLKRFDPKRSTSIVSVGIDKAQDFEKGLALQLSDFEQFFIKGNETEEQLKELMKESKDNRQIILVIHDNRSRPRSELELNDATKEFIDKIAGRRTISIMLTNPYALNSVDVMRSSSVLLGYQNDFFMQKAVLKALLKQIKPEGKLPVTISENLKNGDGI